MSGRIDRIKRMQQTDAGRDIPPPLELECLSALWRLGQGNVTQVREALLPSRRLAYTTVMTVLERLAGKGMVSREKTGRFFRYSPVRSREQVRALAVDQLVERLFDGSKRSLEEYLAANRDSSPKPNRAVSRPAPLADSTPAPGNSGEAAPPEPPAEQAGSEFSRPSPSLDPSLL